MMQFVLSCLLSVLSMQSVPMGVPAKPDPPFAVDGDLADWNAVPNPISLSDSEQVVYGRDAWQSAADLSGVVRLAWRAEHLFVAAEVTDDVVAQGQRGAAIWQDDHIELYIDAKPESEPERKDFGPGQIQIALSPGDFSGAAGEAFCYLPAGATAEGVLVAAKPTADGYAVEAAIPWRLLGVKTASQGADLALEVALSDTDGPEPGQACLMTFGRAPWERTRSRLNPAVLCGTDGKTGGAIVAATLFEDLSVAPGKKQTLEFEAPAVPDGLQAVLRFEARLQFKQVAGLAPVLHVGLNGKSLGADTLLNKPLRVKARGGDVYSMSAGETFSVFYSPDFVAPDTHPHYGLVEAVRPCAFELLLDGAITEGKNTLEVEHTSTSVDSELVLGEAQLIFRASPAQGKAKAGPPQGPLDKREPRTVHKTDYTAKEDVDGRIEVTVGTQTFVVESRFSVPDAGWVSAGSAPEPRQFEHKRQILNKTEAVVVSDTFTNLTDAPLPLMRRNEVHVGEFAGLWLAGLQQTRDTARQSNPCNPTTFVSVGSCGLGMLPLDDVGRIHVTNYAQPGLVGLGDYNLVLAPGATYTAEWAIVPTDRPDYWTFINAARRLLDANFTIDGAFAFLRADPLTDPWTDEQLADFITFKDAHYVCASITYPMYKGRYSHGTSFQTVTHDNYRNSIARWRAIKPASKYLVYFHCFIDVTDDAPERFADSRVLHASGVQADYGEPYDRIFYPTKLNTYGREVGKNVDIILDEIGADGVYWDEHEYSRYLYHFGEPWDGFSGDIDMQKMTVSRLKSSVTLLSEPWRVEMAKRILSHGPLVGNSPPFTRAMAALKYPCFVETGSITNCTQAHLYSPIALGDHLTERSELDAYRTMLAALDYGCVYHWYNDVTVIPTHRHLTAYMYPITPIELHEGYIIGAERIVTRASGLFGWGDASSHEVHVFDDTGREVEDFQAPTVNENGKTYTELRLAEDWSAVLIRK